MYVRCPECGVDHHATPVDPTKSSRLSSLLPQRGAETNIQRLNAFELSGHDKYVTVTAVQDGVIVPVQVFYPCVASGAIVRLI